MTDELISSAEFCRRAGCSYRQLNYWLTNGHLGVIDAPGSGNPRRVPARLVGVARVLALLTMGMNTGQFMGRLVSAVVANYEQGSANLGDGITLSWPVHPTTEEPS